MTPFARRRQPEPLLVEVRRGRTTESRHRVHAVAVAGGSIVASCGRADLVCFLRSAAKPLQTLVLARARPDLDARDLAIASSSHGAAPEQLAAVRTLLRKAGADAMQLECNRASTPDGRLRHMCSGKHAGMLAVCAAEGWPTDGYTRPGHPLQRAILAAVAEVSGLTPGEPVVGVDGCGVPTFALELWRMAHAFAGLADVDAGARVVDAIRTHPELVSSPEEADSQIVHDLPGWIAKAGVEGVLGAAGPDGTGIALKVDDGNARALAPAAAAFLRHLGLTVGEPEVPVFNSHRARVGEIVAR